MKLAIAAALLFSASCSGCATRRPPAPLPIMRYVLAETLPPETQVCVRRDPFRSDLACMSMGELRVSLRGMRRASLEVR